MQVFHLGHRGVRHLAAQRADVQREPEGVPRVPGQPVEPFYEHGVTPGAGHPPAWELDGDAPAGHREVARANGVLVVPAETPVFAAGAHGRLFRRCRSMTRASRSPKTPRRLAQATHPGWENSRRKESGPFMR
jgi:hypothetical protein